MKDPPGLQGLKRLNLDVGREFYNKKLNAYHTVKVLRLYSTSSREIKASIVEHYMYYEK